MTDVLPKEVLEGLRDAQKRSQRKKSRLRVRAGGHEFTILRYWDEGFALDAEEAPHLRGLVDMFDGTRHLSRCLIVASGEESGELQFEYKRMTEAADKQPLDFYRAPDAPVALLGKG